MRAKLTIQDAHNLAESRGLKFLSTEYKNTSTKYSWQCIWGHQWNASYNRIQQGTGCPNCFNMSKKLTTENAQSLAESRGYKFLSNEYKNADTKYLWRCGQGHEWSAKYRSIQEGRSCTYCAGKKTIQDALNLAESKGYQFLSHEFKNTSTKHLWGCGQGHQWSAPYNSIRDGRGCLRCSGKFPKTIQDAQDLAESKGFKFLSTEFKSAMTKHLWGCGKGHEWSCAYSIIKQGSGCPHCAGVGKKTIEDAHILAESRGFKFLSTEVKSVITKYLWGCGKGHEWSASYNKISRGNGCPICRDNTRGEKLTRYCFEKMFQHDFKKIKPDWILNPKTGRKLELDGYNESLKIAFEHQGIHHEIDCPTSNKFYKPEQLIRDEIKRQNCKEQGITLIEVPEIGRRLKIKDVVSFLLSEFDKHNIPYPESAKSFQIDMTEFYAEYMNEKSTTGVDDLLSELDAMDFSDDSLFVGSIVDELNDLDFDDPNLFN